MPLFFPKLYIFIANKNLDNKCLGYSEGLIAATHYFRLIFLNFKFHWSNEDNGNERGYNWFASQRYIYSFFFFFFWLLKYEIKSAWNWEKSCFFFVNCVPFDLSGFVNDNQTRRLKNNPPPPLNYNIYRKKGLTSLALAVFFFPVSFC